jgi:hypothetical protein
MVGFQEGGFMMFCAWDGELQDDSYTHAWLPDHTPKPLSLSSSSFHGLIPSH